MILRFRIQRSPDGAESAGAAVLEAPETASAENAAPETQVAEGQKEPKAAKPQMSDWDRYLKLQEKSKNPNARYSKADQDLQKKYEGKDESLIQGYRAPEQHADDDDSPAPEVKDKKPEAKENPLHKLVGAKSDEELVPKVKGLVEQLKQFSEDRGETGRILSSMGAKSLAEAKAYVKNANALHTLVQHLKAGKPEAFAFIGVKGAPPAQEKFEGEVPGEILDEGLFKHFSPQLKAANERAERLERELRALKGEWEPIRQTHAKSAADNERISQVNSIVAEVSTLAESTEGLWDSKQHGSLSKALNEYYNSTGDYNPGLKPILEILDIAKSKGIDDLEVALSYWERKNAGSLISKAREDARAPFIGKKPSVGLSDQQGNHNGQFKTYTEAAIKDRLAKGQGAPPEWLDTQGTIQMDRVPVGLRKLFEE